MRATDRNLRKLQTLISPNQLGSSFVPGDNGKQCSSDLQWGPGRIQRARRPRAGQRGRTGLLCPRTDRRNEACQKTSCLFCLDSPNSPHPSGTETPVKILRSSGENFPCLDNRTLDKAARAQPTPKSCGFCSFASAKGSELPLAPDDFWAAKNRRF